MLRPPTLWVRRGEGGRVTKPPQGATKGFGLRLRFYALEGKLGIEGESGLVLRLIKPTKG